MSILALKPNQKMPRKAIIDLGTNTFHLLIAEERKIIHEEKFPVRMGLGGINQGIITDAGIERSLTCLHKFAKTCATMQVKDIQAFGTSALRNARNGEAVANKIKQETGIPVAIISGDEEAKLIYQGIRAGVALRSQKNLLMDIGGGSVEFIIGNQTEIFWKQSLEVGGQRLLERFHQHDPINHDELQALNNYLKEALKPLHAPLAEHKPEILVGSSGTFETLSDIYCVREGIPNQKLPESPLSFERFYEIKNELIRMTKAERIAMAGMMEWRAEMIVVTCSLLSFLLDMHRFKKIKVSRYSLKEGVLFG
jgi:exopolyphosphatase/guanosine-5'-triphosphate,3'-diphosphate pyrophosphatase